MKINTRSLLILTVLLRRSFLIRNEIYLEGYYLATMTNADKIVVSASAKI